MYINIYTYIHVFTSLWLTKSLPSFLATAATQVKSLNLALGSDVKGLLESFAHHEVKAN